MRTHTFALLLTSFFYLFSVGKVDGESPPSQSTDPTSNIDADVLRAEMSIARKLSEPIEFNWEKGSLEDALKSLTEFIGHGFCIDEKLLPRTMVDPKGKLERIPNPFGGKPLVYRRTITVPIGALEPVYHNDQSQPFWHVLDSITKPLKLGWTIRDNKILITSPHAAKRRLFWRVYDVGELVLVRVDRNGRVSYDHREITATIDAMMFEEAWADAVPMGEDADLPSMEGRGNALLVRQNWRAQMQIGEALRGLRLCRRLGKRRDAPMDCSLVTPAMNGNIVQVYPVKHLILAFEEGDSPNYRPLFNLVREFIEPVSWEENGGRGKLDIIPSFGALIVSHSVENHRKIRSLLSELRSSIQLDEKTKAPSAMVRQTRAMATLNRLLDKPIGRWNADNRLVFEFLDEVAQTYAIPMQFDSEALDDCGVDPKTRVDFEIERVSVETALTYLLREFELTWTVQQGTVLITNSDEAESKLFTKSYHVPELVAFENEAEKAKSAFGSLTEIVQALVVPESWADVGGLAEIVATKNAVIVKQTYEAHVQIERLLRRIELLRQQLDKSPQGFVTTPFWLDKGVDSPAADDIRGKLESKVTLACAEMPLNDLIAAIGREFEIRTLIDTLALDEVGLDVRCPVTSHLKGVSLQSALNMILREIELTWTIVDDLLLITTPEVCEYNLITVVYPVYDLFGKDASDKPGHVDDWPLYGDLFFTITTNVAPESWDEVGGMGTIEGFPVAGSIVVRNTMEAHQSLGQFLDALRKTRRLYVDWDGYTQPPRVIFHDRFESEEHAQIELALDQQARLECIEQPLERIFKWLSKEHGINFELDRRALDDVGIGGDTPITVSVRGVSLRSALRIMLRELELTFLVQDEVVMITTPEECEEDLVTGFYPVFDIFSWASHFDRDEPEFWDYDSLIELITTTCAPESWDEVGGPGMLDSLPMCGCLVLSQTMDTHEEVAALLESIRNWQRTYDARMGVAMTASFSCGRQSEINEALHRRLTKKKTSVGFIDRPLRTVVKTISDGYGISVQLDTRALDVVGIDGDTPLTVSSRDKPLGQCLRDVLAPLELSWMIQDETLMITTPEECEANLVTRLYPIADLSLPGGVDPLIHLIQREVDPDSWVMVGGPGVVNELDIPPVLVIAQTYATHERIEQWLAKYRESRKK